MAPTRTKSRRVTPSAPPSRHPHPGGSVMHGKMPARDGGATLPSMRNPAALGLGIGGIMAGLGVYIALRALAFGGPPLTGTLGLDLAFAAFFIARGALQFRRWRLAQDRSPRQ